MQQGAMPNQQVSVSSLCVAPGALAASLQMKFNQSARNQPAPPAAAQVPPVPATASATTPAPSTENFVQVLAGAEPQQQKQLIGEQLYRQIYQLHPELTGKITGNGGCVVAWCVCHCSLPSAGMLLEMDNSELLHMLEVPESLKAKVEEAVAVLNDHQLSGSGVPATGTPSMPIATEN
jgi:hypothetical protein